MISLEKRGAETIRDFKNVKNYQKKKRKIERRKKREKNVETFQNGE